MNWFPQILGRCTTSSYKSYDAFHGWSDPRDSTWVWLTQESEVFISEDRASVTHCLRRAIPRHRQELVLILPLVLLPCNHPLPPESSQLKPAHGVCFLFSPPFARLPRMTRPRGAILNPFPPWVAVTKYREPGGF